MQSRFLSLLAVDIIFLVEGCFSACVPDGDRSDDYDDYFAPLDASCKTRFSAESFVPCDNLTNASQPPPPPSLIDLGRGSGSVVGDWVYASLDADGPSAAAAAANATVARVRLKMTACPAQSLTLNLSVDSDKKSYTVLANVAKNSSSWFYFDLGLDFGPVQTINITINSCPKAFLQKLQLLTAKFASLILYPSNVYPPYASYPCNFSYLSPMGKNCNFCDNFSLLLPQTRYVVYIRIFWLKKCLPNILSVVSDMQLAFKSDTLQDIYNNTTSLKILLDKNDADFTVMNFPLNLPNAHIMLLSGIPMAAKSTLGFDHVELFYAETCDKKTTESVRVDVGFPGGVSNSSDSQSSGDQDSKGNSSVEVSNSSLASVSSISTRFSTHSPSRTFTADKDEEFGDRKTATNVLSTKKSTYDENSTSIDARLSTSADNRTNTNVTEVAAATTAASKLPQVTSAITRRESLATTSDDENQLVTGSYDKSTTRKTSPNSSSSQGITGLSADNPYASIALSTSETKSEEFVTTTVIGRSRSSNSQSGTKSGYTDNLSSSSYTINDSKSSSEVPTEGKFLSSNSAGYRIGKTTDVSTSTNAVRTPSTKKPELLTTLITSISQPPSSREDKSTNGQSTIPTLKTTYSTSSTLSTELEITSTSYLVKTTNRLATTPAMKTTNPTSTEATTIPRMTSTGTTLPTTEATTISTMTTTNPTSTTTEATTIPTMTTTNPTLTTTEATTIPTMTTTNPTLTTTEATTIPTMTTTNPTLTTTEATTIPTMTTTNPTLTTTEATTIPTMTTANPTLTTTEATTIPTMTTTNPTLTTTEATTIPTMTTTNPTLTTTEATTIPTMTTTNPTLTTTEATTIPTMTTTNPTLTTTEATTIPTMTTTNPTLTTTEATTIPTMTTTNPTLTTTEATANPTMTNTHPTLTATEATTIPAMTTTGTTNLTKTKAIIIPAIKTNIPTLTATEVTNIPTMTTTNPTLTTTEATTIPTMKNTNPTSTTTEATTIHTMTNTHPTLTATEATAIPTLTTTHPTLTATEATTIPAMTTTGTMNLTKTKAIIIPAIKTNIPTLTATEATDIPTMTTTHPIFTTTETTTTPALTTTHSTLTTTEATTTPALTTTHSNLTTTEATTIPALTTTHSNLTTTEATTTPELTTTHSNLTTEATTIPALTTTHSTLTTETKFETAHSSTTFDPKFDSSRREDQTASNFSAIPAVTTTRHISSTAETGYETTSITSYSDSKTTLNSQEDMVATSVATNPLLTNTSAASTIKESFGTPSSISSNFVHQSSPTEQGQQNFSNTAIVPLSSSAEEINSAGSSVISFRLNSQNESTVPPTVTQNMSNSDFARNESAATSTLSMSMSRISESAKTTEHVSTLSSIYSKTESIPMSNSSTNHSINREITAPSKTNMEDIASTTKYNSADTSTTSHAASVNSIVSQYLDVNRTTVEPSTSSTGEGHLKTSSLSTNSEDGTTTSKYDETSETLTIEKQSTSGTLVALISANMTSAANEHELLSTRSEPTATNAGQTIDVSATNLRIEHSSEVVILQTEFHDLTSTIVAESTSHTKSNSAEQSTSKLLEIKPTSASIEAVDANNSSLKPIFSSTSAVSQPSDYTYGRTQSFTNDLDNTSSASTVEMSSQTTEKYYMSSTGKFSEIKDISTETASMIAETTPSFNQALSNSGDGTVSTISILAQDSSPTDEWHFNTLTQQTYGSQETVSTTSYDDVQSSTSKNKLDADITASESTEETKSTDHISALPLITTTVHGRRHRPTTTGVRRSSREAGSPLPQTSTARRLVGGTSTDDRRSSESSTQTVSSSRTESSLSSATEFERSQTSTPQQTQSTSDVYMALTNTLSRPTEISPTGVTSENSTIVMRTPQSKTSEETSSATSVRTKGNSVSALTELSHAERSSGSSNGESFATKSLSELSSTIDRQTSLYSKTNDGMPDGTLTTQSNSADETGSRTVTTNEKTLFHELSSSNPPSVTFVGTTSREKNTDFDHTTIATPLSTSTAATPSHTSVLTDSASTTTAFQSSSRDAESSLSQISTARGSFGGTGTDAHSSSSTSSSSSQIITTSTTQHLTTTHLGYNKPDEATNTVTASHESLRIDTTTIGDIFSGTFSSTSAGESDISNTTFKSSTTKADNKPITDAVASTTTGSLTTRVRTIIVWCRFRILDRNFSSHMSNVDSEDYKYLNDTVYSLLRHSICKVYGTRFIRLFNPLNFSNGSIIVDSRFEIIPPLDNITELNFTLSQTFAEAQPPLTIDPRYFDIDIEGGGTTTTSAPSPPFDQTIVLMAAILSTILFIVMTSIVVVIVLVVRQRRRNRAAREQLERDLEDSTETDVISPWPHRRRTNIVWQNANASLSSLDRQLSSAIGVASAGGEWRGTQPASVSVHDVLHRNRIDADFLWLGNDSKPRRRRSTSRAAADRGADSSRRRRDVVGGGRSARPFPWTVRSDASSASSNSIDRTEIQLGRGGRSPAEAPFPYDERDGASTHRGDRTGPRPFVRQGRARSYGAPVFDNLLPGFSVPPHWHSSLTEPETAVREPEEDGRNVTPDTGVSLSASSSSASSGGRGGGGGGTRGSDTDRAFLEDYSSHDSNPLTLSGTGLFLRGNRQRASSVDILHRESPTYLIEPRDVSLAKDTLLTGESILSIKEKAQDMANVNAEQTNLNYTQA